MAEGLADLHALPTPRVSLSYHGNNNVLVWTFVRTIFRHFGARYKLRIDVNAATCTLISVLMLVVSLALSIWNMAHPSSSADSSSTTIESPFTTQCIVSTFFFVLVFVRLVSKSTAVNLAFRDHVFLVDGQILKAEVRQGQGLFSPFFCTPRLLSPPLF